MSSLVPAVSLSYPPAGVTAGSGMSSLGSLGSIGSIGSLDDGSAPGFGDVLKNTLQNVNLLQTGAQQQVTTMLQGGGGDVSGVMIAVEKADVAFQLMMQVRNKIVTAYQDIEKMQF